MGLPNFLVVGAAKSGTTAFCTFLGQHPEVFIPVIKEPKFFTSQFMDDPLTGRGDRLIQEVQVRAFSAYRGLFRKAEGLKAVGEASADMLYFYRRTIPLIKEYLGDVRILILLRNPVERAFSAYKQLVRDGREWLSFREALMREEDRRRENYEYMWHYTRVGFYHKQVKAYLDNFRRGKVILFDDLVRDPRGCLEETFRFLGVDPTVSLEIDRRINVSRVPDGGIMRSVFRLGPVKVWLYRMLVTSGIGDRRIFRWVDRFRGYRIRKLRMKAETRSRLQALYRKDIVNLEGLLGRDLSGWLE
ncbi:MAG: sulfotransferase [Fidelibacterota bacterium]